MSDATPNGDWTGLRALVTGGGSGIGAAVVAQMQARGASVVVADLDPSTTPDGVTGLVCDLADDTAVRATVQQTVGELGGLDVIVNNAGMGAQGTVADNDDEEWHRVLDLNLLGIVRTTRAALPHLRESERAAIVNICSVAATVGLPQRALYGASKGAVLALTLQMAADHVSEGIRVNCVSPGTVETPWVGRLLERAADPVAERAALEARQPHGRLVSADEVAGAVCYLAGPESGSTTGTNLVVDGGLSAMRLRR